MVIDTTINETTEKIVSTIIYNSNLNSGGKKI
jgi:hypothetical protein